MQAISQDMTGAEIVGIPIKKIFSYTFGLSTALVGMGGILLAPRYFISPLCGWGPFFRVFVIVAFGGLGSIRGTLYAAWNFTMGYAGIFTFGQFGFFVVAEYASGMITKYLGISPWLGILAGRCAACIVGILVGLPCMKLKGAYIALITFALHLFVGHLIKVGDPIGTGGSTGLMSIPSLKLGGYVFSRTQLIPWYFVALLISFLILLVVYKTIFSSIGLGFMVFVTLKILPKP